MYFLKKIYLKIKNRLEERNSVFRARFHALTRTTTFKVAFSFAGLFLTFALLLLGYIYVVSVGVLSYDSDKAAKRELSVLTNIWEKKGVEALNVAIIERAASTNDNLFVLITPDGDVLSGNIDAVPMDLSKVERPEKGTPFANINIQSTSFRYYRDDDGNQRRAARGVFIAGPDGYGLFVARDLGAGYVVAERVVRAVWTGSLAVLAFALFGGYLAARGAAKRVDELSKTTQKVMAGDLSVRAPVNIFKVGQGDEFDALTQDLNAMLDRTERLVLASRTIGDAIAHDLRSPLTRLRAYLETQNMDAKSSDELHEAIENATLDIDKIVATFNAVLRLSRLEAGQGAILEPTNISQNLQEIAEIFEYSFEDKNIEFITKIAPDLRLDVDLSLLMQAVTNLLDNAIKYTPSGKVILQAQKIGKQVEISIIDSGTGIAPENYEKALKRFERLDAARTTQGSGIGLSLAHAIAEAHKGQLILSKGIEFEGRTGLKATLLI